MSEFSGQPEPTAEHVHHVLDDAREQLDVALINMEHAQKALSETKAEYLAALRENLLGKRIIFSGGIEAGTVRGQDGIEWNKRPERYQEQAARVNNVFLDEGLLHRVESRAFLSLVGGEDDGWEVSVHLDSINWNIIEESEKE